MSDETGALGELRPYLALLAADGVGWEVRELCGRAIVAVARASRWTLKVKTERRGGNVSIFVRRVEMDGEAHELWDRYRRTSDVERLRAELTEHVAALEEIADEVS